MLHRRVPLLRAIALPPPLRPEHSHHLRRRVIHPPLVLLRCRFHPVAERYQGVSLDLPQLVLGDRLVETLLRELKRTVAVLNNSDEVPLNYTRRDIKV